MWPRRGRSDEDFAEEIHAHIAHEIKRLVEDEGLSLKDARAQALRSFGNLTRTQEQFYERRRRVWLEDLRRDTLHGVRNLLRNPAFAAVAILTLAIGIGATTAIYSVADSVLLQPLPFQNADRLVRITENFMGRMSSGFASRVFQRGVPYRDFLEWRSHTRTLSDVIGFTPAVFAVRTSQGTRHLHGGIASTNTFTVLGVRARLGRTLIPSDDSNPNIVVLGFDVWQKLFQSDPAIVGKPLELGNRRLLTIVGVLPAGFEFPTASLDFYVPYDPAREYRDVSLIGALSPGITLQAARDEANVLGTAIRPAPEADRAPLTVPRFEVVGLKDEIVKELQPALRVLLAAVVVVLMIVCANVANLLLARGTARQREMSVRVAIGAGRGRLIRQILTECLVLAVAGGALGALLGALGVAVIKQLATIEVPGIFQNIFGTTILPRGHEVGVGVKVFGVASSIAAATCVLFGLLPALRESQTSHLPVTASRGGGARRGELRLRAVLVVGQLVMATVLLVSAGLLVRSFVRLTTVDKGYDASNVLALQLLFPGEYPISRKADTIDALLTRLRAHPNVQFAGFSRAGVLIGEEITMGNFVPRGRSLGDMRADAVQPRLRSVTEGFLPAMGIRFLSGRDLSASNGAISQPEVVINRSAAMHFFGQATGVGELIDWDLDELRVQLRVVGVVEDLRNESLEHEPFPEVFVHYRPLLTLLRAESIPEQTQTALGLLSFAIRTSSEPEDAIPSVVQTVRTLDPNAGIDAIVPVSTLVSSSVTRQRFYAVMLGAFAAVAAILAAIGIYGVLAYSVTLRTQEIGIRMALGAPRGEVLALVLRKGLLLTTIGIASGLAGASAATKFLEGMLFGITPLDRLTFVAVSLVFGFVAICASYMPARRATRVNPIVALRTD